MKTIRLIFSIILVCTVCVTASAQINNDLGLGVSAMEVGRKLSERYLSLGIRDWSGDTIPAPREVNYPEVCAWFGSLKFADVTRDKELLRRLELRYLPLLGPRKELMQVPDHVDHTVFGTVPLQLYVQTGNEAYYYNGIDFADRQWTLPADTVKAKEYQPVLADGLSWQTRFWIDDMFMITSVQSQAYLASRDRKYIDRAAFEMTVYLDSLQRPNGLFFHSPEAPFFWGRGNGWMAAGMTDLLKHLPEDNLHYETIMVAYLKMMETLRERQKPDGLWGQLVDQQDSWSESSGSAMFLYAMITGIKRGWLDATVYTPVVRRSWNELVTYLDEKGDIKEVCIGTNIGFTREYYIDRPRRIGDNHGQAPMLWCAAAILE